MGERTESRKGVKARVVLARGAMFEFPDDGRKKKTLLQYFGFPFSCVITRQKLAHQVASLPNPLFVWFCQLPTVTAQVFFFIFEGVAGIARI